MIVHDAATAFITLIQRATLAVETLAAAAAFVLCVAVFAAAPLVAPAVRRVRRTAPASAPVRRRPVPSWAHTQPYDYDPAA